MLVAVLVDAVLGYIHCSGMNGRILIVAIGSTCGPIAVAIAIAIVFRLAWPSGDGEYRDHLLEHLRGAAETVVIEGAVPEKYFLEKVLEAAKTAAVVAS